MRSDHAFISMHMKKTTCNKTDPSHGGGMTPGMILLLDEGKVRDYGVPDNEGEVESITAEWRRKTRAAALNVIGCSCQWGSRWILGDMQGKEYINEPTTTI